MKFGEKQDISSRCTWAPGHRGGVSLVRS